MHPRHSTGFTLVELAVAILFAGIVGWLALSAINAATREREWMSIELSKMKELQLATQEMTLDETTTGDTNSKGWPGDCDGSFSNWTTRLVQGGYFSTNDLHRLLSAPGQGIPPGVMPSMAQSALLAYAVKFNSPPDTVFLTTANFINTPTGGDYTSAIAPYSNGYFAVFRKDGDGMPVRWSGQTNSLGNYVPLCRP